MRKVMNIRFAVGLYTEDTFSNLLCDYSLYQEVISSCTEQTLNKTYNDLIIIETELKIRAYMYKQIWETYRDTLHVDINTMNDEIHDIFYNRLKILSREKNYNTEDDEAMREIFKEKIFDDFYYIKYEIDDLREKIYPIIRVMIDLFYRFPVDDEYAGIKFRVSPYKTIYAELLDNSKIKFEFDEFSEYRVDEMHKYLSRKYSDERLPNFLTRDWLEGFMTYVLTKYLCTYYSLENIIEYVDIPNFIRAVSNKSRCVLVSDYQKFISYIIRVRKNYDIFSNNIDLSLEMDNHINDEALKFCESEYLKDGIPYSQWDLFAEVNELRDKVMKDNAIKFVDTYIMHKIA